MSHSQFRCITLILRHAWLSLWDKHMTTGRINQITIVKRPRKAELPRAQELVFQILYSALEQSAHGGSSAQRLGAFVTCNQLGVHSQSADGIAKCSFPVNSFVANLLAPRRTPGVQAGFALRVDIHTLVTHNDTIIFCSLREGLTYSLRAQHA